MDSSIHWIPPEFYDCIENAHRSLSTDVWAFGTTLWQIFSFGSQPTIPDVINIKEFYRSGKRLPKPLPCPLEIFRLILECWHGDLHQRKRPQAAMRDINRLLYQGMMIRLWEWYWVCRNLAVLYKPMTISFCWIDFGLSFCRYNFIICETTPQK
ncbi:hypothetical protein AAG570_013015 [Ranatra chinensis]|uniref:Protein kinase domain-containing protein n=1 Tax=Ranatra chinensis TaxID=642074 RepID=A0ABD0YG30_9HEMI